jgi:hypothetical protein
VRIDKAIDGSRRVFLREDEMLTGTGRDNFAARAGTHSKILDDGSCL